MLNLRDGIRADGRLLEEEYLALETNRLIEFDNGTVEVLQVPTDRHQAILASLFLALRAYAEKEDGIVRFASLRLRLWSGKNREPDILYLSARRRHLRGERFWEGADLVVEVVSLGSEDRERDLVTKRLEYARAGIPEYWIVDPQKETITVLQLEESAAEYAEHGDFCRGTRAASALFPAFSVSVDETLDAD
jgi:Uma2 family endonuclease